MTEKETLQVLSKFSHVIEQLDEVEEVFTYRSSLRVRLKDGTHIQLNSEITKPDVTGNAVVEVEPGEIFKWLSN